MLDILVLSLLLDASWSLLGDHDSLVSAVGKVIEHLVHLVDERGVAGQVLHLLVGDDQAADGLRQVDEERGVAHVVLRDLSLVISEFSEVLARLRSEYGQADDGVANHHSSVLDKHAIIDAHQEPLLEHETDV